MESCTPCEESFKGGHPLRLSIAKSGSDFLVYAQNVGKNLIFIRRIVVCRKFDGGMSLNIFRDETGPGFVVGGARIEPGLSQLKVKLSAGSAASARAQAEYYEVTSRAMTCEYQEARG